MVFTLKDIDTDGYGIVKLHEGWQWAAPAVMRVIIRVSNKAFVRTRNHVFNLPSASDRSFLNLTQSWCLKSSLCRLVSVWLILLFPFVTVKVISCLDLLQLPFTFDSGISNYILFIYSNIIKPLQASSCYVSIDLKRLDLYVLN